MLPPLPPDTAARARVSIRIDAPADRVLECIVDVEGWPVVFARTIETAGRVGHSGDTVAVAVRHRTEGDVLNLLTIIDERTVVLAERKRRFDAWFRLAPVAQGKRTKLDVLAFVRFRGAYALLSLLPFAALAPFVRRRLTRFLLLPVKRAAERSSRNSCPTGPDES